MKRLNWRQKRIIKKFVQNIDPEIKIKFNKKRFECDILGKTIYLKPKMYGDAEQVFMNWFNKEYSWVTDIIRINYWVISMLHEIGHIMTDDDDLHEQRDILTELLKIQYENETLNKEQYFEAYFKIPCEQEATNWGVNYYTDHLLRICDLLYALGFHNRKINECKV